MTIRQGGTAHRGITSIIEVEFESGYELFVFQGALSQFDILIRYKGTQTRMRTLIAFLAVQEKTNMESAFMFPSILDKLLRTNIDIFQIISTATHNGR